MIFKIILVKLLLINFFILLDQQFMLTYYQYLFIFQFKLNPFTKEDLAITFIITL